MTARIEATRYCSFTKLHVKLGEFRVLVGSTGAGKTTHRVRDALHTWFPAEGA